MGTDLAKTLRKQSTGPERRFWRLLHPLRVSGWHFRKQVQIGAYYVDFACFHAGVVIEIDGETHGGTIAARNDETRDAYLVSRGFRVLRFSNDDVMRNPDGVYRVLVETLAGRPERPKAAVEYRI